MNIKIPLYSCMLICCYFVAGCASYVEEPENSLLTLLSKQQKTNTQATQQTIGSPENSSATESPQAIHYYVERLAEQFFITTNHIDTNKTVAIGTFLPINQLNGNTLPNAEPIAHQIQESFVTIATQVGLNVLEFKTMKHLKIKNNQDIMLSRQVDDLNTRIEADYFLTGNYIEHKNQLVVNARLIALPSRKVIAAATDYIPKNVMTTKSAVVLKNNQLYRGVE